MSAADKRLGKTMTLRKAQAVSEMSRAGNLALLLPTAYWDGVEAVATILRPRFESGELRGWLEGDEERFPGGAKPSDADPPLWRVETACTDLFIGSPEVALMVLRCSPKKSHRETWRWDDASAPGCLLSAAHAAMATDVLQLARARGWSKVKRGERPAATRSVARTT